jgi:iron complex outermembrane recepter protein
VAKRNGSLFLTWKPEMGWYAETGLTLVGASLMPITRTPWCCRAMAAGTHWRGIRHKDWDVKAALNNISDKTYYASATSANQIQFGEPRSLVVTGTYNF